jgi:hypothetical protein
MNTLTEREMAVKRLAAFTPHDVTARYVWGDDDDGEPASGKQTTAIIGTIIAFCLLLAGLAYLVWAGSHGLPWTR